MRHFLRIDSNDDSIEDFLGNEIFNRDYVYNKKKTDDEKRSSIRCTWTWQCNKNNNNNKNSAPGIDGWSYRGANLFWNIFRIPLTNTS